MSLIISACRSLSSKRFMATLFALLWSALAHPIDLEQATTSIKLSSDVYYFEDPSGELSYDKIASPNYSDQFKKLDLNNSDVNFGFSKSTYWLRIPIKGTQNDSNRWVIEIPYLGLGSVELYGPVGSIGLMGLNHLSYLKPFFYRYYAFQISPSRLTENYYLRVRSKDSVSVPIVFWSEPNFLRMTQIDTLVQGLYYGGILALLIYNLIIGIFLRDRGYLLYVLYLSMIGMGIFAGNGYGNLLIWPSNEAWNVVSQAVFLGLGAASIFFFTRDFLNLKIRYPRLDKIFIGFAALYLLSASFLILSVFYTIPESLFIQINLLASLPAAIILIATTAHAWLSGQQSARFFLLGWGVLAVGASVAALRAFGWFPTSIWSSYAVQISTSIEMLLFSFALADRVQDERKALIVSQGETLRAKQELVSALRLEESRLEGEVAVRTAELKDSLDYQKQLHEQYIKFVSMISHEFRNPLNIIEVQSALIYKEGESGASKLLDRMKVISNAVHRVSMLFDKWLQNDRLNSELDALHLSEINLDLWLDDLVKESNSYHEHHKVKLVVDQKLPIIFADEQLLKFAMLNLIDNACKYSPQDTTVVVSAHQKPGWIGLSVQDEGIGIAPENTHAIFTEYFRVDHASPVKGMGLGLPFVKRIMHLHKGSVELVSAPNEGSCFYLWLPLETSATAPDSTHG